MVRQLLKNVASLLKPGGYFFGATPDSSTIWFIIFPHCHFNIGIGHCIFPTVLALDYWRIHCWHQGWEGCVFFCLFTWYLCGNLLGTSTRKLLKAQWKPDLSEQTGNFLAWKQICTASASKTTGTFLYFLCVRLSRCLKINNRTSANCGEALVSDDSLLCVGNGSRLRLDFPENKSLSIEELVSTSCSLCTLVFIHGCWR